MLIPVVDRAPAPHSSSPPPSTRPSASTWRLRLYRIQKPQQQRQQPRQLSTAANACSVRGEFLQQLCLRDKMVPGDRGLGIELGGGAGGVGGGDGRGRVGHVYPTPPPEDRLSELRQTSGPGDDSGMAWEGEGQNKEAEKEDMVAVGKVLKLSHEQLGELLPLDTTSTPFILQPSSSSSSPARRARSSTLTNTGTGPARPLVAGRTLSTPPTSRRVVTTPARNPNTTSSRRRESGSRDRGMITPKRKNSGSTTSTATSTTVVHNYGGGDASYDTPGGSDVDKVNGSRREGSQPTSTSTTITTPSALPPLPFQSYLSLALSSPTSASFPDTPSTNDDASTQRAGPVYGKPPHHSDDSAEIAMERIMNFFLLPPKLEAALVFGVFACLDSWLYIFTILPLRFLKAIGVLMGYWRMRVWNYFNYDGNKLRKKSRKDGEAETPEKRRERKKRKETNVSGLNPNHKADILRGMILFTSCWFLMRFDASQMYHSIRGQSGIKLYVIYNMLDVSSGIGFDSLIDAHGWPSLRTNYVLPSDKTSSMCFSLEKCSTGVPTATARSGGPSRSFCSHWPTIVGTQSGESTPLLTFISCSLTRTFLSSDHPQRRR